MAKRTQSKPGLPWDGLNQLTT
uniref:Uncharacterized protein n=1 Tax=Triticum urartu TaxID=4572 RepID=A0A8R7V9U0_TRIUA